VKLRDRALIGALTVALIVFSVAALAPTLKITGGEAAPTEPGGAGRAYVEGVLGRATNASPFGARSSADRALVALLFRGLVKLGPGTSIVGDLASSWQVDDSGRTWTFHLRPDQRWEDGEPITADDVAFTIDVLSSPIYTGQGGESWRDVATTVIDATTVELHLTTPLGGFLQAATQPIAPVHVLGDIPPDQLPDDPFGQQPVASGPYRLVYLDTQQAVLAALTPADVTPGVPGGPNFGPRDRPTRWPVPSRRRAPTSRRRTCRASRSATTTTWAGSAPIGPAAGSTPRRAFSRPTRSPSPPRRAPVSCTIRARRCWPRRSTCALATRHSRIRRSDAACSRRSIATPSSPRSCTGSAPGRTP